MIEKNKIQLKSESEIIALAAAREAICEFVAKEKADRKKQIFQNTNLLLEHYLDLKAYGDNAIYQGYIGDEEDSLCIDGYEITIKSIKANREVTLIIISHIDMALSLLKKKCQVKDMGEKYKVIEFLHLDENQQAIPWSERISLVSDDLCCGETTVRRWRNEMVKDLSVFLFGVDGLKLGI